ncbi:MAG: hypothetical protein KDA47_15330, partial [Planctomycetales bacterium]|nr:hypothetical protein [Planctomycetales bacterium]
IVSARSGDLRRARLRVTHSLARRAHISASAACLRSDGSGRDEGMGQALTSVAKPHLAATGFVEWD